MKLDKKITEHFLKGDEKYLRHVSIDCVVFGFHENELKVLLLKTSYSDKSALPGGFILKKEPIDDAAQRIL
jgi:ADP-ribose pyrophosphatase YjhB (NUDIX family)